MNLMHKVVQQVAGESARQYRKKRERKRKELLKKYERVFFAHEICQCKHKFRMEQKFPELVDHVRLKANVVLGNLVEKGVGMYMMGEWEAQPEYKRAVGGTLILGHPDFYDKEEDKIMDVKFRGKRPFRLDHHVFRMKVYNFLAGMDRCSLLYFSPEGLKEEVVKESLSTAQMKEHLDKAWRSPLWEDWECKLCNYEHLCSKSEMK